MRGHLRTIIIVGLTAALMAFFLRSADLSSVWSEISRARLELVVAGLAANAVSYVIRVGRWQRLLAPIGQVGFGAAAHATVIGFATTALLPGRLGEVLRPYLLARRQRLSVSAALATIVLERLLDLIAVVMLLGVFLLFFSSDLPQADDQVLAALRGGGIIAACGAALALILIVVAARAPGRIAAVAQRIAGALPERVGSAVGGFLTKFHAGLGIARQPGRFLLAFAWSFPLWLCVCVSAWCVCQAFGIALPPSGSLPVMVMMVLGVAVPTPAGLGSFHAAVQVGVTSFYAAPVDAAVGAALVLHLVSFGPVTLLGIIWMARDGLTLRGAMNLASGGFREVATRPVTGGLMPSSTRSSTTVAIEPGSEGGQSAS
jgi:hypothetical protein